MRPDHELLHDYATSRSEAAFAELVSRHLDFTYDVARRQLGDAAHLADDVAQQVFCALARKARAVASHPTLRGWLHESARTTALQTLRTEFRRRDRERKAHTMHEPTLASAHDEHWEKLRPTLDAALAELGSRDRDALALRFFEGCAFAEIGTRLKLSEDAARMRVDRALDKMSALLARRGVTSTTAALATILAAPALSAAPAGLAASITASALATGAVSTGLIATLGMTKLNTALATAAVVAGGALTGTALLVSQAIEQDRAISAATVQMHAAIASAEADRQQLEARLAALDQERAALDASLAETRRRLAERTAARPSTALTTQDRMALVMDAFNNDAALTPMRLRQLRLTMIQRYGDFFDELGLPPDQLEPLKQQIVAYLNASQHAFNALSQQGIDIASPDARAVLVDLHDEMMQRITAQFGAATADALTRHEIITSQVRPTVDELALDLEDAGLPIDGPTKQRLTQALFEARFGTTAPRTVPGGEGPVGVSVSINGIPEIPAEPTSAPSLGADNDARAQLAVASTVLSPEQLVVMQRHLRLAQLGRKFTAGITNAPAP